MLTGALEYYGVTMEARISPLGTQSQETLLCIRDSEVRLFRRQNPRQMCGSQALLVAGQCHPPCGTHEGKIMTKSTGW